MFRCSSKKAFGVKYLRASQRDEDPRVREQAGARAAERRAERRELAVHDAATASDYTSSAAVSDERADARAGCGAHGRKDHGPRGLHAHGELSLVRRRARIFDLF